jgi:hypothetical protein
LTVPADEHPEGKQAAQTDGRQRDARGAGLTEARTPEGEDSEPRQGDDDAEG